MNLSDVYGQMGAVSYARKPKRAPLAEQIHAELPAKKVEGRAIEEKKQFETEQAQDKELFEKGLKQTEEQSLASLTQEKKIHEENLAEVSRQHEATMEQKRKEMAIAEEQAEKTEGIQAIGMGVSGGKLLSEWAKDYKGTGGEYAGYAAPLVVGFGVGYGVAKYTGSRTKGMAAGVGAAAAADYLQSGGESVVSMTMSSIGDFVSELWPF